MMDIDLEAIRKRDAAWRDNGKRSNKNSASLDRRALLAYIAEVEELVKEIGADIRSIRAHLLPPAALSDNAGFLDTKTSDKLPP